ncbi:PIR protein [Plasmodium ovale]|uniref:PIR Superfamily Protein n=2 Tax=Plasmodium ovale TaxID=36330 RepID=A0A1A8XG61_PLAOA|nr:PIR Superfamily Protein [Plasmodium ovale curtisi]SBT83741.1 PIR protein [Plasmodium ovale]
MSTRTTDPILQELQIKYPILSRLPLFRIYNLFYNYSIRPAVNSICSSYIKKYYENLSDTLSTCEKIENIIVYTKSIVSNFPLINIDKYCEHLSYFIYEKIKNITTKNNYEEFYKALNDANIRYKLKEKNCNITNFKNNEEGYDKKKELFFRSEILQWIKIKYGEMFSGDEAFCNKYFQDCVNFYNNNIKNEYCKLAKLHDNEIKSFLKNFRETKEFLKDKRVNITIDDTYLPQESICSPDPEIKLSEQEPNSLTSDSSMISSTGHSNAETTPIGSPNSNTDKTLEILISAASGIVLVFPILYKFTPFGTWLHNRLRTNKGKVDLEAKTEEFDIDNFENEDITSYSDIYNINYHSARNS